MAIFWPSELSDDQGRSTSTVLFVLVACSAVIIFRRVDTVVPYRTKVPVGRHQYKNPHDGMETNEKVV